uniref:Exostosin GT47 domain-containing protein n=1 Tax=viral metagenome TaxID=1070528 RepID=A0A6C0DGV9_9ZZZZ
MTEANCLFVSSRGIMKSCDVYPSNPVSSTHQCYDYDWVSLKPGTSVYIISSSLPDFFRKAWSQIKVPIILVSGDCDETMPTDLFDAANLQLFLNDPRLIAWFAQNMVSVHPKLHQIPIGMDYHTLSVNTSHAWGPKQTPLEQESVLNLIRKRADDKPRLMKAYANFQFSLKTRYAADRHEALKELNKDLVTYEEKPVARFVTWAKQATHQFVISPHGGGLDCHRTWEALALGCYPIVKTSPMDPLFEGLPVLILEKWSDLRLDKMEMAAKFFSENKMSEKLNLKFWLNKIFAAKQSINAPPENSLELTE